MRLQSRYWLGLQSLEGLTGAGRFASKLIIHSHFWQVSAECCLEVPVPPHIHISVRLVCVLRICKRASPRVSDPRQSEEEASMPFIT